MNVPCARSQERHGTRGPISQRSEEITAPPDERRLETLTFASWNQIGEWLRRFDMLRQAAERRHLDVAIRQL
jgi:hypothetical protein